MAASPKRARVRLSPPDVTYFNEIRYSVGSDPLVRVDPLRELPGGVSVVTLRVRGLAKAQALATLLVPERRIGSLRLLVVVRTSDGRRVSPIRRQFTPQEIVKLFRTAFRTNTLFQFVATQAIFGTTFVYPVFRLRIVQFFNDDLSDFYRNYNNVAAFVFRDVLRNTVSGTPIQFSTARKK